MMYALFVSFILLASVVEGSMSYQIRRSKDRGYFDHGWLKTYHTFSFADYYNPQFMGYRMLRVINDDTVAPGQGFGMHGHKNMEIITVVLKGKLAHTDSMGNEQFIEAGEIQAMSAGKGVRHSEYNASNKDPVQLMQIWIVPNKQDIVPRYQQRRLPEARGEWVLVASADGGEDSLLIEQDVKVYATTLDSGKSASMALGKGRYGWLHVMEGEIKMGNEVLHGGDGVAFSEAEKITIHAIQPSKILFFDLN